MGSVPPPNKQNWNLWPLPGKEFLQASLIKQTSLKVALTGEWNHGICIFQENQTCQLIFSSFVLYAKKTYTYQLSLRESAVPLFFGPGVSTHLIFSKGLHLARLHLARDDCSSERLCLHNCWQSLSYLLDKVMVQIFHNICSWLQFFHEHSKWMH